MTCENCGKDAKEYWMKRGDEITWFCSIRCLIQYRDKTEGAK